jgi:hypothetical protein
MKLFIASNIEEKTSKVDGILYPYITKKGLPIAFEEGSIFWKTLGKNGDNSICIAENEDYIISPKGSLKI